MDTDRLDQMPTDTYKKVRIVDGEVKRGSKTYGNIDEVQLYILEQPKPPLLRIVRRGKSDAFIWDNHEESVRPFNHRRSDSRNQARRSCVTWAIQHGYWDGSIEELMKA